MASAGRSEPSLGKRLLSSNGPKIASNALLAKKPKATLPLSQRALREPAKPTGPPPSKAAASPPPRASPPTLGNTEGEQTRLFVGNLSREVTEGDILKVFTKAGTVINCQYMYHFTGPHRGQPKGFCFVDMASGAEALQAIEKFHGRRLRGRELRVNMANPDGREDRDEVEETGPAVREAAGPPKVDEAALERRARMLQMTLERLGDPKTAN